MIALSLFVAGLYFDGLSRSFVAGGKKYTIVWNKQYTQIGAKQACRSIGAELTKIDSAQKMEALG